MKIVIDDNLKGKELYQFLVENKGAIVAQKKAMPKMCDAVASSPSFYQVKEKQAIKTAIGEIPEDATSVRVKIVANASLFMDSQKDVLLPDSWAKSIKDGKGRLHLKDHTYKMDAEVGDVANIYSQDVSLSDLGLSKSGKTQVLIYESDVKKSYDEKVFNKYKSGKVNQHSIGLQYVDLKLAVNDEDYKEEFALWNKYIDQIINIDDAEKSGYFWIVPEIKLIEVSAVLMGANELTPTLSVGSKIQAEEMEGRTQNEPLDDTHNEPLKNFNLSDAIRKTTFFT